MEMIGTWLAYLPREAYGVVLTGIFFGVMFLAKKVFAREQDQRTAFYNNIVKLINSKNESDWAAEVGVNRIFYKGKVAIDWIDDTNSKSGNPATVYLNGVDKSAELYPSHLANLRVYAKKRHQQILNDRLQKHASGANALLASFIAKT